MKILRFCGLLLVAHLSFGQPDTDVFIAELNLGADSFSVANPFNVSNNPGYDNQPSFTEDGDVVLYARTRNGQTDIYAFGGEESLGAWVTDTPGGSEYSPLQLPDQGESSSNGISFIRLDTTGLQRLYRKNSKAPAERVMADLKIGYHLWYSSDILVCTVLVENRMDLVVAYPEDQTATTYQKQVGRSLHRIPGKDLISYVSMENGKATLKSMDPISGSTAVIAPLPDGIQDVCWLPNGKLICGGNGILQAWNPQTQLWKTVLELGSDFGVISRIAVNKQGSLIAMVNAKAQSN